jgi:hypothetical protein
VAIVQISQITNRKGLNENLPQLAGAEFGWSTDTRQLYIGNGTLEEGAPVIGNTEILTEFSDILGLTNAYTYQGTAAGYTAQTTPSGTPVTNSLQAWMDQYASVLDFGAVGDGVTDCTEAINWALYQLYCREPNPQVRRSLFFPAGVYLVSGTINIPSYATLIGEGADNSIISRTAGSVFTGTIANTGTMTNSTIVGTTLTVGTLASGTVSVGMLLSGGSIAPNTYITGNLSGSGSGSTWIVSVSQNLSSTMLNGIGPGNILTVDTINSGTVAIGQKLHGPGIAPGTTIVAAYGSNWIVNIIQSVTSVTNMIGGVVGYVAQTADSLQQTGVNIALGGATPPTFITVQDMGFQTADPSNSVFSVDATNNGRFQNVTFSGFGAPTTDADSTAGIVFNASNGITNAQIVFDACQFSGTTYGVYNNLASNLATRSVTVQNSLFQGLFRGVYLFAGITGARIVANAFDSIYAEGIVFKNVSLNASGQNIFYDVGNHFNGITNPATTIIDIQQNNNISISDMFQRNDSYSNIHPRININDTVSIATTNGTQLSMGTYTRQSGLTSTLVGDASTVTIFTVDSNKTIAFSFDYTISRNNDFRTGRVTVATNGVSPDLNWEDTYTENGEVGIEFVITQSNNVVTVAYNSTSGVLGAIYYSVTYLV